MYRKLTANEIEQLQAGGSSSADWGLVEVTNQFDPCWVKRSYFEGAIRLGAFNAMHTLPYGPKVHAGIYNAKLYQCTVGDDALIMDVVGGIANYDIGAEVLIVNCNQVAVTGETTFGNGTRVSVLNETGGREVPIYDYMSAHLAYIIAMYRHHVDAVGRMVACIDRYAEQKRSSRGHIGRGVVLIDCQRIYNTAIQEYATVSGATLIEESTILSSVEAPTHIGQLTVIKQSIVAYSSVIDGGAMVDKCYVGEGCLIGKQYSAENSLFFANCMGMHGEACSIFAGPYTVTHHKSTLLIAGYFSFMNAGSGSNQSNHMYKLGPIHQGIVERGVKTSSDGYVLWPARIGAFSLVMGRLTNHLDTSNLPFSYLLERDNKTTIIPGAALRSVGTVRDAKKWPKRDKRKATKKIDQINFNLLSPYTIQKMVEGVKLLTHIKQTSGEYSDVYIYNKARIVASALEKGMGLYSIAINKFLGNSIISRLGGERCSSQAELTARLRPSTNKGKGVWVDLAGLIAPKIVVDEFIDEFVRGNWGLMEIQRFFEEVHANYYEYEWTWAAGLMCDMLGKPIEEVNVNDIVMLIEQWKQSVTDLDWELYADAKKEFTLIQRIGFGIDGDQVDTEADFEQVRGVFESNDFVKEVLEHIDKKQRLGNEALALLSDMKR